MVSSGLQKHNDIPILCHHSSKLSNVKQRKCIMTSAPLTARLRFLDASARHYSTLAPATSAHLMLEAITVATDPENTPPKGVNSKAACGACGTIRIPGVTSRTTIVDLKKPTKGSLKKKKKGQLSNTSKRPVVKQVVVECLRCHRKTITPLQPSRGYRLRQRETPDPTRGSGVKPAEPRSSSLSTVANPAQLSEKPVSSNSSSKKRAKTRKQGGLQAMLEKSKGSASSPSGFGLDLMDFMKQV